MPKDQEGKEGVRMICYLCLGLLSIFDIVITYYLLFTCWVFVDLRSQHSFFFQLGRFMRIGNVDSTFFALFLVSAGFQYCSFVFRRRSGSLWIPLLVILETLVD